MSDNTFMDRVRSFLGIRPQVPRNDFRNPIWGSDDDDDGDELYTREQQIDIFNDPLQFHQEFAQHMQDMFQSFNNLFGDIKGFLGESDMDSFKSITELPISEAEPESFDSNRIRDYYLKPGYHEKYDQLKQDTDLDGKISSNEISGLLQQKDDGQIAPKTPFSGFVPGKSFCQTIITTSVMKPDGTTETRRIVKKGNEVIEETTTTTEPDARNPYSPRLNPMDTTHLMLSQLSTFLRNFY